MFKHDATAPPPPPAARPRTSQDPSSMQQRPHACVCAFFFGLYCMLCAMWCAFVAFTAFVSDRVSAVVCSPNSKAEEPVGHLARLRPLQFTPEQWAHTNHIPFPRSCVLQHNPPWPTTLTTLFIM